VPIEVHYKGYPVGHYFVDIIVDELVALELKAQSAISAMHEAQLLNYLKAGGLKLGMLINFSYPKATIKRLVV
jgi:GxxExxY protein